MLRVISYNIHSGVGMDGVQSYSRIGEFLKRQRASIVLLQEFNTRAIDRCTEADQAAISADYFQSLLPSSSIETENGWYGNAILSTFPVVSNTTYDVSVDSYEPRNIQEAVLQTPGGRVRVVNTHKGLKRRERRRQFSQLHEHLRRVRQTDPLPTIVGGDFNEWQLMSKAFRVLDASLNSQKLAATFPTGFPLFRLDRFWTSREIDVISATVVKTAATRVLSDHYPIQLDLCF